MHQIIESVKPKENLIIRVVFANGKIKDFDIKILFEKYPVFTKLVNIDLFNLVKVDGVGYGVYWDDDLDLSSDIIFDKGVTIGETNPDIKLLIGQNISEVRCKRKMSQRDLSKESGVIQAEICKIELGKSNPTIDTLYKIAKALKTSISELTRY